MKLNQKLLTIEWADVALFPQETLAITQGINEGTHLKTKNIDIAGKDGGPESAYAPCQMKVVFLDPDETDGHAVVFESTKAVCMPGPDGKGVYDYLTMRMVHDNIITDLKLNQVFEQGQKCYDEGVAGNATGNHIHLSFGRGKYQGVHVPEGGKYYALKNEINPWEAVFVNGTVLKATKGYAWKMFESDIVAASPTSTIEVLASELRFRAEPNAKGAILGVLPKGAKFPYLGDAKLKDGYVWVKLAVGNQIGYAAYKGDWMKLHLIPEKEIIEKPINIETVVDGIAISVKTILK